MTQPHKTTEQVPDELMASSEIRQAETARQMKADGMAVENIAKYTGLPVAEIATL